MSQTNLIIMILLTAAVTYGLRISFIVAAGSYDLPPIVQKILTYAPPAVLFALITPSIIVRSGAVDISLGNARIWAGLVAIVCAWTTRNLFLTIILGMCTLWSLNYFGL